MRCVKPELDLELKVATREERRTSRLREACNQTTRTRMRKIWARTTRMKRAARESTSRMMRKRREATTISDI